MLRSSGKKDPQHSSLIWTELNYRMGHAWPSPDEIHYYVVCACRCESFNGVMRQYNVNSNRQSSSRDIATKFSIFEQLRLLCDGGGHVRYVYSYFPLLFFWAIKIYSAGRSLKNLYLSYAVQQYLFGTPMRVLAPDKEIYQHGSLRKVGTICVTKFVRDFG